MTTIQLKEQFPTIFVCFVTKKAGAALKGLHVYRYVQSPKMQVHL